MTTYSTPSCVLVTESPWVSPAVVVQKKDRSLQFCVDYRCLNNVTTKVLYPLPRIDNILDSVCSPTWFSTLDLHSGYWQVPLSPSA
ncbi:hypothetical protein AAFF_G00290890 [Aldrovandia affinis]|uniref:Reverse transcriptase n=1 Tax=Aldrovandia affinis TaxID=143900 RepID=A0AAD7W1L2_9TELE|nr:hypothetical protein AAFF_G00290890 [Aldrovandia affinis]